MFNRLFRSWRRTQRSQLFIVDCNSGARSLVYETHEHIEAPNWHAHGRWLVFNGDGKLFRVAVDGSSAPERIDTGSLTGVTNDHVIAPDGQTIYFTAAGCIYAVPFVGGMARKISDDSSPLNAVQYYVHGISADARMLSCVGVTAQNAATTTAIHLLPTAGGASTQLTHTGATVDGPEFSPDGRWLYFNAELHARRPGDSQLFRMHMDGTHIEQLTFDSRVNWFPHISPDGNRIAYLSYPENTRGHPANKQIVLRTISADGGEPVDIVAVFGGQGTMNTNSWAPQSDCFAYVCYVDR